MPRQVPCHPAIVPGPHAPSSRPATGVPVGIGPPARNHPFTVEITRCAIAAVNLVMQYQLSPIPVALVGDLRYDEGPVAHSRGLHSVVCEARLRRRCGSGAGHVCASGLTRTAKS